MSEYKPPKHPQITTASAEGEIWISSPDATKGWKMLPAEAISLGIVLMETGLHLKARAKLANPTPQEK